MYVKMYAIIFHFPFLDGALLITVKLIPKTDHQFTVTDFNIFKVQNSGWFPRFMHFFF